MFELNQLTPKKTFSRIGWVLTFYMCLIQGLGYIVAFICYRFFPNVLLLSWFRWVETIIIFYIIAFPIYMLLMRDISEKRPIPIKKYNVGQIICLFTICYAAGFLGNLISIAVTTIIGKLIGHSLINPVQDMLYNTDIFWTVLVISILAPIFEELTFRKILINKLLPYGTKTAIIVSAFAFAMCHGNLSQIVYAFILGVIFAYIAIVSGKIKYTIILHMMVNFIGSVIIPTFALGDDILKTGIIALGIYIIIVIGIIFFIVFKKSLFPSLNTVNENTMKIDADFGESPNTSSVDNMLSIDKNGENYSVTKLSDVFLTPGMLAFSIVCIAVIVNYIIMK